MSRWHEIVVIDYQFAKSRPKVHDRNSNSSQLFLYDYQTKFSLKVIFSRILMKFRASWQQVTNFRGNHQSQTSVQKWNENHDFFNIRLETLHVLTEFKINPLVAEILRDQLKNSRMFYKSHKFENADEMPWRKPWKIRKRQFSADIFYEITNEDTVDFFREGEEALGLWTRLE